MQRHFAAILLLATALAGPVLGQCPDGSPPPCAGAARGSRPPASIAVLYFDNLSRDTGDVYLADGFTEELMNRLGQVEGLQIKSRTAVLQLRGRSETDTRVLGRTLNVAHLVSGSVLRQRGRIRVTVELTRVATGNRAWGGSFDRSADDLIATEAEIAESVAVNVGARLAPAEVRRVEARPTRNAAAYDHLLRGRFEQSRRTTAAFMAAIRQYESAVRLDSMFTSAWVALSTSYNVLAGLYYSPDVGESRESLRARGEEALNRALRQDSTSAEALRARAIGGEYTARSMDLLRRAVALDPRNAEGHHLFALNLRQMGRDSEAVAEFQRAVAIDPDRAISLLNIGQTLYMQRRFAEARRWIDSAVQMRPEAPFFYIEHGLGQLMAGDTAAARSSAEQAASHGSALGREEILAVIAARSGDSAAALVHAARVDSALANRDCVLSHECLELAMTLAMIGARDRALTVLERISPRRTWLAYWTGRPEFDVIRAEPRFQRLVEESRAAMRSP